MSLSALGGKSVGEKDIVFGTRRLSARCNPSSIVVGCRRIPGTFRQRRGSTGGATPSRLAAVMERGSVGQTFRGRSRNGG